MSKFDTFVYDDEGRYLSYVCTFYLNTALSGTRSYTYDAKGRLTGETFTPLNRDNTYSYDDAGNHIGAFHGETLTAADYDRSNQRVGEDFTYNAEGDPTEYKGDPLTFDAEHHLTSYGTALAAKYGPNGTRMWKDVGQTRTTFCYDGNTLVGQQTGEETFAPIISGLDGLIAFGETYYQFDPEGNVVHRLDTDGDLVNTSVYDAWGVATDVLPNGDPATVTDPFGYKGQYGYYTDRETGLILCMHRFYDPELGRWLTRDPIEYNGGINLYGYCGNDPVNRIDPTGFEDWLDITTNVVAGAGDVLSCGLTVRIRRALDCDDVVDKSSEDYAAGKKCGFVIAVANAAASAPAAARAAVAGTKTVIGFLQSAKLANPQTWVRAGAWAKNAFQRGWEIERMLGGMLNNFPTID